MQGPPSRCQGHSNTGEDTPRYQQLQLLDQAGEVKLSVRDLLALVATFGDLVRAASLRALRIRADTLAASSGVFCDAGTGTFALVAFSFMTCMHKLTSRLSLTLLGDSQIPD